MQLERCHLTFRRFHFHSKTTKAYFGSVYKRENVLKRTLFFVIVGQFREAISLCGEDHFWTGNQDGQEKARANLRRKIDATTAGISTYGKCGQFHFVIKAIEVLETQ